MSQTDTTIVVVPREQFSVAQRSLQSIYEHTDEPFHLIYVDGNSPRRVKAFLEEKAEQYGFQLLRSDSYLSPNQARNWSLEHVSTKYVVFVDNDLIVSPAWLTRLARCAEETGAWAVGPLYLEGEPADRIIHVAGGAYEFQGKQPHRGFSTTHVFQKKRVAEIPEPLVRKPCDFVEFHCMLVKREIFDQLGQLDEELLNTREHLDLCIQIQENGGTVYFEPESVVTYKTPPPLALTDVPFFMLRWSEDWTSRSLKRFTQKYGLDPSYQDRAYIAASRRGIVFSPLTRFAQRLIGKRGASILHGGMMKIEPIVNRLVAWRYRTRRVRHPG